MTTRVSLPDFVVDTSGRLWNRLNNEESFYALHTSSAKDVPPWTSYQDFKTLDVSCLAYRGGKSRVTMTKGVETVRGIGDVEMDKVFDDIQSLRLTLRVPDLLATELPSWHRNAVHDSSIFDGINSLYVMGEGDIAVYREGKLEVTTWNGITILRGAGDIAADYHTIARFVAMVRHDLREPKTPLAKAVVAVLNLHQPDGDKRCAICETFYPCETVRFIDSELSHD